jgi:hypothetical protein
MGEVKKNKSSVFIIPMIMGIPYKYFSGFVNCYIGSNYDDNNYQERIYIVFNTDDFNNDKISNKVETMTSSSQFVNTLIVDDFTVLSYKPPEVFLSDFIAFKNGEYSKFSEKYKSLIKALYPKLKDVHSIIEPTGEDRAELGKKLEANLSDNCEIFDSPYESDETFSLAHFLNVDV